MARITAVTKYRANRPELTKYGGRKAENLVGEGRIAIQLAQFLELWRKIDGVEERMADDRLDDRNQCN